MRAATTDDLLALYGYDFDDAKSLFIEDGVALGGTVDVDGVEYAMLRVLRGASAKALVRAARRMCAMLKPGTLARRDPDIPCADRFLRRMGFVPVDGVVYELRRL